MDKENIWFKLFASCIVVKGNKESLIYDLERHASYPISNEYANILNEIQQSELNRFKAKSKYSSNEIDNFIGIFIDEELAFLTDSPKHFTNLDLVWESPHLITNAIIQLDDNSTYSMEDIVKQLNNIGCQAIQLRIESKASIRKLEYYVSLFDNSGVRYIELLISRNQKISRSSFFKLISAYPRVGSIKIYNSKEDLVVKDKDKFYNNKLFYLSKSLDQIKEKAIQENFRYNITIFSEAQNYNIGLNRKVAITNDGYIKNFLSHKITFGNINEVKIKDIVSKENFQKFWYVSNDVIEKCKDCQYRYCCPSNTEIKIKNERYYKTESCDFDPYKNVWNFQ